MSSELAVQTQSPSQNPVSWAIANNVSPEQMLQYYQLDREIKADAARNAFNEAFASFKAEAVKIVKGTKVKSGPLDGTMYANLFDVVDAVIPALSKHGLSHSWKLTKDEKDWMEVTCFIRHSQGHSESVSMGGAPDAGPGRNAIQARGSAKSYLQRYTLLAAVGMAASDEDNDGASTSVSVEDIEQDILSAPTEKALADIFNRSYLAAAKDSAVQKRYRAARDVRRGELCAS